MASKIIFASFLFLVTAGGNNLFILGNARQMAEPSSRRNAEISLLLLRQAKNAGPSLRGPGHRLIFTHTKGMEERRRPPESRETPEKNIRC